jgi:hypothetical protein
MLNPECIELISRTRIGGASLRSNTFAIKRFIHINLRLL